MIINKTKVLKLSVLLLMLTFLACVLKTQAEAASAQDFYKDKKITFIASTKAGGGTDMIVRLMAPYLRKYTEAYSVVVDNVDEGGGMLALNRVWNSKPDGLMITCNVLDTTVMMELSKEPGVQYQSDKFNVIFAASSSIGEGLIVSATGPLHSIDDLKKAKGLKCATPYGGAISAAYAADVLGLDARITTGITTADATMALLRGETQFATNDLVSVLRGAENGTTRALAVTVSTGLPLVPQAPPLTKFAALSPKQKEWSKIFDVTDGGKYIWAGPNIPPERIEYLRTVFEKIHQDPQFLQDRKKFEKYPGSLPWLNGTEAQRVSKNYINFARGEEHRQMVEYLSKKYFTVK